VFGLFLPDCSKDGRGKLQRLDRAGIFRAAARRQDLFRRWPLGSMDRAGPPPRPHFLGDERQKRRKQPKHGGKRAEKRAVSRRGERRTVIAITAALYELQVVVAEEPEKGLTSLEDSRVVELVEIGSRFANDARQHGEQAAIDRRRHRTIRFGFGEN